MELSNLNRRDFSKLTLAAAGGLMTGALAGCSGDKPAAPPATGGGGTGGTGGAGAEAETSTGHAETTTGGTDAQFANFQTGEKHICRGLNMCKGLDPQKDNECAGQGDCATVAEHTCHAKNECKGQGGCGETVGLNACTGKGECGVRLNDEAWAKARAIFEQVAKSQDKAFGDAPAKTE